MLINICFTFLVYRMDTETDQEFWNSLELISTNPDSLNEVLCSYLKSNSEPDSSDSNKTNRQQGCDVQAVRSLPITTIISRIQAEESDGEEGDSDRLEAHPPPNHTGGKWKPSVTPADLIAVEDVR